MTADDSSFTGNTAQTTTYTYYGSRFHATNIPSRPNQIGSDFRGHSKVVASDASGKTEYRFFQGMDDNPYEQNTAEAQYTVTSFNGGNFEDKNWLVGQTLDVMRMTSGNSKRHLDHYQYASTVSTGSGIYAARSVAPNKHVERVYDNTGSQDGVVTTAWTYDAYGNRRTEVKTGTLTDRATRWLYAADAGSHIVDRPYRVETWAGSVVGSGNVLSRTDYFYDGYLGTGVLGAHGALTRKRVFTNQVGDPNEFAITDYTYTTTQGQLDTVTDPNGNTTDTDYNPTHGYVSKVTNDLGHQTEYAYDTWVRQSMITDPSNVVITLEYDDYSRVTGVFLPGDTVATYLYAYSPGARPARVRTQQRVESGYQATYDYVDGFGRPLQTQTVYQDEDEATADLRRIVARRYDASGGLHRESTPFVTTGTSAGAAFFNPAWGSVPNYHEYAYDESGRVKTDKMRSNSTIQNTTTYTPDGLDVKTVDMVNRRTLRRYNMAGGLTRVDEYAGTSSIYATTTYVWDALDRLARIHDAMDDTSTGVDDIRITYDMASRKRRLVDPASGFWYYDYDASAT